MSRCQFVNCRNTNRTHSLFRFPASDESRLRIWINNSGNKHLTTLTREQLKYRTLCEVHFDPCYKNHNETLARLTGTAIPRHYCEDQSIDISPEPVECPVQGNTDLICLTHEKLKHRFICEDHFETKEVMKRFQKSRLVPWAVPVKCKVVTPQCLWETKMNEAERKRRFRRAVRYGIFQDCLTKKCDKSQEIGDYVSRPEEDQQCPDAAVLRPNKVYHKYHSQIRAEIAKDSNNSNVSIVGNKCAECERAIHGFQWWCVRCAGARCGACARRMTHRAHYLLRAPAHSTQEQTQAVISLIRQQLGEDSFVSQDIRHVDEDGVDLMVTDEPEVKVEPPDVDDPCNPTLDPLAFNPSVEDPLGECKPVLQDLTSISHEEPSIDYQPETNCVPSLESLVDPDHTGEPYMPLAVEFCSPVHPGIESYEMSLAQCSGIDDFRCSGWDPSDQNPGDISDGQSSHDDDPPTIKRSRAATHHIYTGDDSDDSTKEIDHEPTHSHTETDTEDDQTNRPKFPEAKRKKLRSKQIHVEDPMCEEQSSTDSENQKDCTSEQSDIGDTLCEEQIVADSEKQKNHNRSEQSHIEDSICEEQTSTVSEIQDSDDTSKLAEIQDNHKDQKSRKKNFIVTKKRFRPVRKRNQYPTHIQRNLEPTDRHTDSDVRDPLDLNMTTESSNTLLNLEDYIFLQKNHR